MRTCSLIAFLCVAPLSAEIVDRLAVTVASAVVTLEDVRTQVRVAALIDGQPLKLEPATLREAAERLVDQTIIRREMVLADYTPPEPAAASSLLAELKKTRFQDSDLLYRASLEAYRVSEPDLVAQLQWQVTLLRFIDSRFRPGIQVSPEDVLSYYEQKFIPDWRATSTAPPPPAGQVRNRIELLLEQQQLDASVERWLNQARTQTVIRFREEAFR
jgi:peptidyl-prolyl cis-trans isomerase SurA